jgi:chlorophyll/bacteriochlorophyll a synthase
MLRLIKPITWFPPIWAFLCGAVSSGIPLGANWQTVVLGMVLAGPIVCGMSQAANDWCDRHVDAVNEPDRPIPSGRIPGRWGLYIALAMTGAVAGRRLAPWPLGLWRNRGRRHRRLGLFGRTDPPEAQRLVGAGPGRPVSYEGLPWFTGAAVLLSTAPRFEIVPWPRFTPSARTAS